MADFVAVIRRAVDGLASNTPEMRAKVYDKARGAVQRQLENMKPRPPEDMLRRQMEKLEAAIVDVESEHAEALAPVVDEAPAEHPAEEAVVEPVAAEPVAEAGEEPASQVAEPVEGEAVSPEQYAQEQQIAAEEAAEPAPAPAEYESAPVFREDDYRAPETVTVVEEPAPAETEQQAVEETAPVVEQPSFHEEQEVAAAPADEPAAVHQYGDWRDDMPPEGAPSAPAVFDYDEPATEAVQPAVWPDEPPPLEPEPLSEPAVAEPVAAEDDFPYPTRSGEDQRPDEPEFAQEWAGEPHPLEPEQAAEEPPKAEEDWGWAPSQPEAAPAAGAAPNVAAVWNEVPELVPAGPAGHELTATPVEAHFDTETHVSADTVRMPPVSDLPVANAAVAAAAKDPIADYLDPQSKPGEKTAESDPWADLEELIGFNKDAPLPGGTSRSSTLHSEADADDLMPAPARPYRVTPVRKRNYAGIILAIVGLALVGAGGYAIWLNRDSLNDMVDGLFQSSAPTTQTAEQTPAPAPATPAPSQTPPPSAPQINAAAPATPATPATPAPADGSTTTTKFTQRLMADGSEVDDGPGGTGGLAQNAEGQSVAQLNTPPAAQAATPEPAAPAGAAPAPGAGPTETPQATPDQGAAAPSANPSDAPALAGEKMFLYEERIGQTAPTAIEGAVSWSLQREPGANGRPEPVIQGRINIPGRGLTALVTVKRNGDPSLPASHLVEIVFAVPPDFEGGAIDSVQRIAMKQTEQDRGNALIAVPAKITDDFHMIALNDFPDARTTNLELLRSRNWIDIPVAYRNGRRALFTLQKGPEGERIFAEAIREWATLGAPATGQ